MKPTSEAARCAFTPAGSEHGGLHDLERQFVIHNLNLSPEAEFPTQAAQVGFLLVLQCILHHGQKDVAAEIN